MEVELQAGAAKLPNSSVYTEAHSNGDCRTKRHPGPLLYCTCVAVTITQHAIQMALKQQFNNIVEQLQTII